MSGRLTVSLSAITENYQQLCSKAQGQVAAVVKADAYGLGAAHVAGRLQQDGCREFFVATAAEGVLLRQTLPEAAIFVFEGAFSENVQQLVAAHLTPVLNTAAQCEVWGEIWADTGLAAAVHVDTGMQRLGFDHAELQRSAAETLLALPFEVSLLISHFARADEPGHPSVEQQLQRTLSICSALQTKYPEMRMSMCNSAGLLESLGPEDLGRAGIALYGGNPFQSRHNPMLPVAKLEARVMQLRELPAGTPVGYGGTFVTQRDSRIAILGVGYADGVPRLLSDRGAVWLADQHCPIVGRVSMDLMAVDVTALTEVCEGDWAEVMGAHVRLDEIAAQAQTLAYEVLTHISNRIPRIYLQGSI
jgi:alanine racemase